MSSSLSYQEMPPWLLEPLMDEAISLVEAAELHDLWLQQGSGPSISAVPMRLRPAVLRMQAWQELKTWEPDEDEPVQ